MKHSVGIYVVKCPVGDIDIRGRRRLAAGGLDLLQWDSTMTFLWPNLLWLLFIIILPVVGYIALSRRKSGAASRYPGLSAGDASSGRPSRLRKNIPPLLLLLALTLLLLSVARPAAEVTLPSRYDTVILAIDVSGSMKATDVSPNRFGAAKVAIRKFIEQQASSTRIGIVAFASSAALVQAPTSSRSDVLAAVDKLEIQRGTAIGSALLVSLKTIFPSLEIDLGTADFEPPKKQNGANDTLRVTPTKDAVAPGSYRSAAIVLLTDGQATSGPDPIKTAQVAADRGLRVFTVGVGTPQGAVVAENGWSARVVLDEDTLKKIAQMTKGEYFQAGSAEELVKAYKDVTAQFTLEKKEVEITALFAALAAFLSMLSVLLSMLWFNRIL